MKKTFFGPVRGGISLAALAISLTLSAGYAQGAVVKRHGSTTVLPSKSSKAKPAARIKAALGVKRVKTAPKETVVKAVKNFKGGKAVNIVRAGKARNFARKELSKRVVVQDVPTMGMANGLHNAVDQFSLQTGAALLIDAKTHEVLYAKNADAALPIASITKLMTALLIVESGVSWDEDITITEADVDREKNSSSRLPTGTQLTRGEMLNLALMSSENRAAHAMARSHPGGLNAFVAAMNAKAKSLGMHKTRYVDPTGLSQGNLSSPMDLAKLVSAASTHDDIRRLSTKLENEVLVKGRRVAFRNTNSLVHSNTWDIVLQKTGYIREAGRCVVMEVKTAGRKMVMVLLDSATSASRVKDAQKLRNLTDQMSFQKVVLNSSH